MSFRLCGENKSLPDLSVTCFVLFATSPQQSCNVDLVRFECRKRPQRVIRSKIHNTEVSDGVSAETVDQCEQAIATREMNSHHVTITVGLALCVWVSVSCVEHGRKNPYDIHDYKNHPCIRTCKEAEAPKNCKYYFLVEHYTTLSAACYDCYSNKSDCSLPQCVTGAGLHRPVLTVNRMVPGPALHVCQGDTIEVLVDNRMELGEGTTIHWHGVTQKGTPYMDGTSMITQCPITKWSKMKYSFIAAEAGTQFWHSHAALQRSDGLFGSLVIRQPKGRDPHNALYDMDLPEHTIMLNDWSRRPSADSIVALFHRGDSAYPSGILVNGRARAEGGFEIPYAEFHVRPGLRYRFRVIYSGILNCPIYVRVDGHKLLMISADGKDFKPVEVDSFTIYSGERYDFVIQTKEEDDRNSSYWMRFKGHNACSSRKIIQAAVLRYSSDGNEDPSGEVTYDNTVPAADEVTLSDESGVSSKNNIQIVDLKSLGRNTPEPDLVDKPDKKFYIALARSTLPDDRFLTPAYPGCPTNFTDRDSFTSNMQSAVKYAAASTTGKESDKCRNPTKRYTLQLNYITGRLPPAPPLTQYEDINSKLLCNGENIKGDCTKQICDCVHTLKVSRGDLVELVLVNPRAEAKSVFNSLDSQLVHPMHIHGHSARVVTMLRLNQDISMEALKDMDERGEIARVRNKAPYKDTIPVGDRSVVIIRFRADNPGFWFFHCHIELHTELGMALVIQSGEVSEMPQPPIAFPKCKSWEMDDVPPDDHKRHAAPDTSLVAEGEDDGCMGLCSNNTHRKFFTTESLMITGVALLICLSLPAIMLGALYCLRRMRGQGSTSPYRIIRRSAHGQVGPYSSLSERDEAMLSE
ncbi:hypothetical protein RRG08_030555 [Elysia crispata]|uniref:Uncharacterized protein n=1 Tax=Elysia crispata TaxID=231223 RepID=A0AAE0Y3F7_9GAST|nr:hypothetical protein RRG08_030555 [Elysia crispata]